MYCNFNINGQTLIPLDTSNWDLYNGAKVTFESFEGQQTVKLKGKIFAKQINLSSGTVEVDVFANSKRSFAGIIFRQKDLNMEDVYMRTHKNGQVDAIQYTPIYNGESNWQLYKEYQAQVAFNQTGWNKLKVVFQHQIADIYVNDTKVLTVDKLRTDCNSGSIGLFSLFENQFANFRYSENVTDISLTGISVSSIPTEGLITQWQLTDAFELIDETSLPKNFDNLDYQNVTSEDSGLLPISKYISKANFGNFDENTEAYTIAKHEWTEKTETTRIFSFDYSDKILVYLNGMLLFNGNNTFRSKGVQFMGHMEIESNKLILPLKKGKNVVHCVVIEQANGWGLAAKIQ
ncbi:MAG: DUF1080 domain-containing protein [Saprospiraceae bacterium]|nr:DUF1080 domain-containing protein [Saprospiraceae bacterium]